MRRRALAQVPTLSQEDLEFFLHGSVGTEVVPEAVLRAFIKTYPELFLNSDLRNLGLIPGPDFGWPIGLSRTEVKHLDGLSTVGSNCASCHVAELTSTTGGASQRILGATSHFDVEAFFGAVLVAAFKTSDPANMKKSLAAYLDADPKTFAATWQVQEEKIVAAIKNDSLGAKNIAPGELHEIANADVRPTFDSQTDLAMRTHAMQQLFQQHARGVACARSAARKSAAAFRAGPQRRVWIAFRVAPEFAAAVRRAPQTSNLQFALVKRQTDLTEKIRPPKFPFEIDEARRGAFRCRVREVSRRVGKRRALVRGERSRD